MTPSTVEELLREGEALLRGGERERARAILSQAVRSSPRSEQAWLLLAGAVTDPEQRRTCLERVLRLNPQHAIARKVIATLPPPAVPQMAPTEPQGGRSQTSQPALVRPAVGPTEVVAPPPQPPAPPPQQSRVQMAQVAPAPPAVGPTEAITRPAQPFAPLAQPVAPVAPPAVPAAQPVAPVALPAAPPAPRAATVVDTIRLERDHTIALSEEAIRRTAADRLLWQIVLAVGIVLMLAGATMAGVVLLAG